LTPTRERLERRSRAALELLLANKAFAKSEAGYRRLIPGTTNGSPTLKRAFAQLLAASRKVSTAQRAARSYSLDPGTNPVRILSELPVPVCRCGCGGVVDVRTRGRLRAFATAACRTRAWRRRDVGLPEGAPRLSPGGRANLAHRMADPRRWIAPTSTSTFQPQVLESFREWRRQLSGLSNFHYEYPHLFDIAEGLSFEELSDRHRRWVAAVYPAEPDGFMRFAAGRTRRSRRVHFMRLEQTRFGLTAEAGCGRRWPPDCVVDSIDPEQVTCPLCRDRLARVAQKP